MGRYYFSKKEEADYLKKIEIGWLKKQGYLQGLCAGTISWSNKWSNSKSTIHITVNICGEEDPYFPSKWIQFVYSQTDKEGNKRDFDYKMPIVETPCHYGGRRYWFKCALSISGQFCGRRVGTLYKDHDYFGCRHCYNLTYHSRNENRRGSLYAAFAVLKAQETVDKLEQTMKLRYYAGKPTRKQRRIDKIAAKTLPYTQALRHGLKM